MSIPVIAIFDVGKTNKKLFLFDEHYHIVYEKTARFIETTDEDGDACENLASLERSVFNSLREVCRFGEFDIKAINFSTYGASFVHIGEDGKPVAPLYNYLKDFPEDLLDQFYKTYGGQALWARETSSPVLGNLNSGMQLYRIKHQQPELFNKIKYSLHLPQYMSYLLTGTPCNDITSIGCHTGLWDFEKNNYHAWVYQEGLTEKFAPIVSSHGIMEGNKTAKGKMIGVGLHDSSAALIPYLVSFSESFLLISTGTWCISLNPFNQTAVTDDDLENDCLCYMQYKGSPVKASRLFAGNEHEIQVKRIAAQFDVNTSLFRHIDYDNEVAQQLKLHENSKAISLKECAFGARDLASFSNYTEAYHQLIMDIMDQQYLSTKRIISNNVKRLFVDGGFGKNAVYMNLLAAAFPEMEVFAAAMAQATAIGTALAIHHSWNSKPLPSDIIELKHFAAPCHNTTIKQL